MEIFKVRNQRGKQILYDTVETALNIYHFVYLKYCDKPYFHFWFQEGIKYYLLIKERNCFHWKGSFHKICLPDGWVFLITQ